MGLLGHAIGEISYVVRHSPPSFVLLPELLTKRAELRIRRGELMQAAPDLNRAITLKPDYWPAYVALSDLAKQGGEWPWRGNGSSKAWPRRPTRRRCSKNWPSWGPPWRHESLAFSPAKPPPARQPDGSAQQAPEGKPETDTAPAGQ